MLCLCERIKNLQCYQLNRGYVLTLPLIVDTLHATVLFYNAQIHFSYLHFHDTPYFHMDKITIFPQIVLQQAGYIGILVLLVF